jgi:hypothetical protein
MLKDIKIGFFLRLVKKLVKCKRCRKPVKYKFIEQGPNGVNVTRVFLNVTELRISPAYSTYANWSQSLVLGFLPTVLLAYFNTKIYLDVRYANIYGQQKFYYRSKIYVLSLIVKFSMIHHNIFECLTALMLQ